MFKDTAWDKLPEQYKGDFTRLGWDKEHWEKNIDPGPSSAWNKGWQKLSGDEQRAAEALGYTAKMWKDPEADLKAHKAAAKAEAKQEKQEQKKALAEKKAMYNDGLENVAKDSRVDMTDHLDGHPITSMGWYNVQPNRAELQYQAQHNLALIHSRCVYWERSRRFDDVPLRWTNCEAVFPFEKESGSPRTPQKQEGFFGSLFRGNGPRRPARGSLQSMMSDIVQFPPHDQQYYIQGIYDRERSQLSIPALPSHMPDIDDNSTWMRLSDFAENRTLCRLFRNTGSSTNHFGRVFQGALSTGWLVEALNAVSIRPALANHLFYHQCYDVQRGIYIARLYKHGLWRRIELDDYVPVGKPPETMDENVPICCRSESFPMVLWPSLVEKAAAKLHTWRGNPKGFGSDEVDAGGWEALDGGGRVEDALVMLTGGVTGRFRTQDVTADRLFIYVYEMQRDTLFVCRPNQEACEMYGVQLNPYHPYAVNRAVSWEGRLFVQVFCAAPTLYDGGLQDISVPYSLSHNPDYPETGGDGFFWCDANDFHLYFDTIFECHLTNTPPCDIPGMPPPRLPPQVTNTGYVHGPQQVQFGTQHISEEGEVIPFFETVWACKGAISRHNPPEFTIIAPDAPCEIYCSFDQLDSRTRMLHPGEGAGGRKEPCSALLKCYEEFSTGYYKNPYVAKSQWLPINHSMLAFRCRSGGRFLIEVGFPEGRKESCEGAVFRCYCSVPGCMVEARVAGPKAHVLVEREPNDINVEKLSIVGSVPPMCMENPDDPTA